MISVRNIQIKCNLCSSSSIQAVQAVSCLTIYFKYKKLQLCNTQKNKSVQFFSLKGSKNLVQRECSPRQFLVTKRNLLKIDSLPLTFIDLLSFFMSPEICQCLRSYCHLVQEKKPLIKSRGTTCEFF